MKTMNESATFIALALLIGLFASGASANFDIQEQQREDESRETMHYILALAENIVQEGGDPIDVLEDALAKLRRGKTKRSLDHDESHLSEEHFYDAEEDDFEDHDHFEAPGDHLMGSSLHDALPVETHLLSTDKPKESSAKASLPMPFELDDDDLETPTPSVNITTATECKKNMFDPASQAPTITNATASANTSYVPMQTEASSSTPGPVYVSSPVMSSGPQTADLSPMAPESIMMVPKLGKEAEVLLGQSPLPASVSTDNTKHEPVVSTSISSPVVVQESSGRGHSSDHSLELPKNEHFEDEYIDTSDPSDPKLVHIKKKTRTEVGPNGHVHEHHESQSSTSLGNNPNSFSRQSSSSSSINSFSSYRSGPNGQPVVSDTIITTDDGLGHPYKPNHKPKRPQFTTNDQHHHHHHHHQQPLGNFPNMPMVPLHMPLMPQMPSMPMMPYGMPMSWPNFYGGQAYESNFGKQPTGMFGHIAPNGQGAYASAFASAGGFPAPAGFYEPQSDEQSGRMRRHVKHQLSKHVNKKRAHKLGFHRAPGGHWTD